MYVEYILVYALICKFREGPPVGINRCVMSEGPIL